LHILGDIVDGGPASDDLHWYKFPKKDCGYDDIPGSCEGQSVEQCKELCLKTSGCGGFNYPHGVLKKTDCLSQMADSSKVDTYVLKVRVGGCFRGLFLQSSSHYRCPPSHQSSLAPLPFSEHTGSVITATAAAALGQLSTGVADAHVVHVRFCKCHGEALIVFCVRRPAAPVRQPSVRSSFCSLYFA
jgi:hypothetical protein